MEIKGVRLHFVYSFAFSHLPLREPLSATGDTTSFLGDYLASELSQLGREHYQNGRVQWHQSEEEEPPEFRAALFVPFPHLSIQTREEPVVFSELGTGTICSHLAFFESGMGVMWILVIPDRPPDQDTLSRVACRGSFPSVSTRDAANGECTGTGILHDIFVREVEILHNRINEALGRLDPDTQMRLSERHPSLRPMSTTNQADIPSLMALDSEFRVAWLDRPSGGWQLLWSDGRIFEEPSVAMIVEVRKEDRDRLDLPSDQKPRQEVEQVISQLLHTTSADNLDRSHSSEHRDDRLVNLYPDRRFRTFAHGNCLLVLHAEPIPSDDFTAFTKGLFRIYCGIRGCWHIYSIVNEQLDHSITYLLTQLRRLGQSGSSYDARMLEKFEEIILIKGYFLIALSTEDPLSWGVRLTPFGPLDQVGRDIFCLTSLRDRIEYKLGELDKLFEMISSYGIRVGHTAISGKSALVYWAKTAAGLAFLATFTLGSGWLSAQFSSPLVLWIVNLLLIFGGIGLLLLPPTGPVGLSTKRSARSLTKGR